jgi:hypothetical protein
MLSVDPIGRHVLAAIFADAAGDDVDLVVAIVLSDALGGGD